MKVTRRGLLEAMGGYVLVSIFFGALHSARAKELVRPPGALVEDDFLAHCIRCNQCIDACPTQGLRPAGIGEDIVSFGTPTLGTYCMVYEGFKDPDPERIVEEIGELCLRCTDACPTGALQRVEAKDIRLGTVEIDHETCLGWIDGSCSRCVDTCPFLVLYVEDGGGPAIRQDFCWGCGQCVVVCPVAPKAIWITPEGAKRVSNQTGDIQ